MRRRRRVTTEIRQLPDQTLHEMVRAAMRRADIAERDRLMAEVRRRQGPRRRRWRWSR